MFNEAIQNYEKALTLSTKSVSTYAGLAYTYHLQVFRYFFHEYLTLKYVRSLPVKRAHACCPCVKLIMLFEIFLTICLHLLVTTGV